MRRWFQVYHRARTIAVSLLILALLPTPWPKVEFHNVRHHDEAGQVCEHHDHLLRWHPNAAASEDVAILHWHWGWPVADPSDADHAGTTPRLHAFLADDALPTTESAPAIVPDVLHRSVVWVAPLLCSLTRVAAVPILDARLRQFDAGHPRHFAPRTSLTSRLQRWSC